MRLEQAITAAGSTARLQPHAHTDVFASGGGERDATDLALLASHFKEAIPDRFQIVKQIIDLYSKSSGTNCLKFIIGNYDCFVCNCARYLECI
jgi:hypothetical protein